MFSLVKLISPVEEIPFDDGSTVVSQREVESPKDGSSPAASPVSMEYHPWPLPLFCTNMIWILKTFEELKVPNIEVFLIFV